MEFMSKNINLPDKKLVLLFFGLIFCSVLWIFLNIYFNIAVTSIVDPLRSIIQAVTFIFIPLLWFILVNGKQNYRKTFKSFFGTKEGLKKRNIVLGIIEGNLLYATTFFLLFAIGITQNPRLFSWFLFDDNPEFWNYMLGVVVSVTSVELITKGYVMMPLIGKYNNKFIFSLAMLAWLIGHIVEYFWLIAYIDPLFAVFIIVSSGVVATVTVLRYENLFGMWSGHLNLNVILIIFVNLI